MLPPGGNLEIDHLLAQVSKLHHARARTLFRSFGLHRGQPPLLYALGQLDGQTHSELADALRVSAPTISKMVQRLERAGFVERRADPEDQRVSRVHLTETGRAIHEDIARTFRSLGQEIANAFTPEEQVLLHSFLIRIRDNLLSATESESAKEVGHGI